jgi:hypothetical protein
LLINEGSKAKERKRARERETTSLFIYKEPVTGSLPETGSGRLQGLGRWKVR